MRVREVADGHSVEEWGQPGNADLSASQRRRFEGVGLGFEPSVGDVGERGVLLSGQGQVVDLVPERGEAALGQGSVGSSQAPAKLLASSFERSIVIFIG